MNKIKQIIIGILYHFEIKHRDKIINYLKNMGSLKTIVDVGSHYGEFIARFISLAPDKIYSFEPNKISYDILKKNFSSEIINIYNFGVGDENETKLLSLKRNSLMDSFLEEKKTIIFYLKKIIFGSDIHYKNNQTIEIKKLDSLIVDLNIKNIDLLKIDVEGYELFVLNGAKKTLTITKYILIEIHDFNQYQGYKSNDIINKLRMSGFKKIKSFRFITGTYRDVLFANENL